MFIDQFTPEQLQIIKEELKMSTRPAKYNIVDFSDELRRIFPQMRNWPRREEELLWLSRVRLKDYLYEILDVTLCNVEFKPRKKYHSPEKEIVLSRSSTVSNTLQEEYKQMAEELLAVIEKHKKELK